MVPQLKSYFSVGRDCIIQIKEGDQLTLRDPYFRDVNLSWKEKVHIYYYKDILDLMP